MEYQPTWESVAQHPLPRWFDDAKLGIFLHWGLYSVPGWAPRVPNIQEILREHGPSWLLRNNPYAEWYANTMQLEGSPSQEYHARTYGAATPYQAFRDAFNAGANGADLDALVGLCERAGARYVVLTTKHHDGFCLWPATRPHPTLGGYSSERDIVGDLTRAVRARGLQDGALLLRWLRLAI